MSIKSIIHIMYIITSKKCSPSYNRQPFHLDNNKCYRPSLNHLIILVLAHTKNCCFFCKNKLEHYNVL